MKKTVFDFLDGDRYAVLKNGLFAMKITLLLILIWPLNLSASGAYSRTAGVSLKLHENSVTLPQQARRKISGIVTDQTGVLLPGVSVVVKGTTTGVTTDANGKYAMTNISENATLLFSFIGMKSQEIVVGSRATIDVSLAADVSLLDEVVVVAYGSQKKRELIGSMATVKADKLLDMPVTNIGQKMQGKFAGVQINQTSGEPGGGLAFRVRGQASINGGNSPLIVIDGFPSLSGIGALSPNEIESISVLKDASASSLYGSRAANGVILITTKNAKEGQKSIEFSSYYGFESVSNRGKPNVMNGAEFAQF